MRNKFIGSMMEQLRPKQWTKNTLVFAAPLFSMKTIQTEQYMESLAAFVLFCFISSCVYIMNDYLDLAADRTHPLKRHRPMASGRLPVKAALTTGGILLLGSFVAAFLLNSLFGILIVVYFLVNMLYSFKLKHYVIIDIMAVASGFALRAIGGGVVISVPVTPWFLLCIMLLALFLAIGKRRHELIMAEQTGNGDHRKVLQQYSLPLLDQMNGIVTSGSIICYALFTFTSDHPSSLMWTVPIVVYGMFRYLYLIHIRQQGGTPDKLLFEDRHILVTVLAYALSTAAILYFSQ